MEAVAEVEPRDARTEHGFVGALYARDRVRRGLDAVLGDLHVDASGLVESPGEGSTDALDDLYRDGRTPTQAELEEFAESNGWHLEQFNSGPAVYLDETGVERLTIKSGSARTPGSEGPHVEYRGPDGKRYDPETGDPVTRRSPGNHRPYTP